MSFEQIIDSSALNRLFAFILVFSVMSLWESAMPRRARQIPRHRRWRVNLALIVSAAVVVRLVSPFLAVAAGLWARHLGWGLLPALALPSWLALVLTLVFFDLAIYLQHRVFHGLGWLWRLHRVHHADPELDASSGTRFHPLEILLSALWRGVVALALGASPQSVLVFELLLNGLAVFNHANLRLPSRVEFALRCFIVTPDMHRVHHSIEPDEYTTNFGFNLSLWDRLFRSYRAQPRLGHEEMRIGLRGLDVATAGSFAGSLWMPFRSSPRA